MKDEKKTWSCKFGRWIVKSWDEFEQNTPYEIYSN